MAKMTRPNPVNSGASNNAPGNDTVQINRPVTFRPGSTNIAPGNASAQTSGHGYFSTMEFDDLEDLPSEVDQSAG